jgi:hemoglobin
MPFPIRRNLPILQAALAAAAIASATGCAGTKAARQAPPEVSAASLYDRLGGISAITLVVDEFLGRVVADPRVNGRFAGANVPRLRAKLIEQVAAATGGPYTYTGLDMRTAHRGMKITAQEFDILAGHLAEALAEFQVPERETNELMGAIASMRDDIVEDPPSPSQRMEAIENTLRRMEAQQASILMRLEMLNVAPSGGSTAAGAVAKAEADALLATAPKVLAAMRKPREWAEFTKEEIDNARTALIGRYSEGPSATAGEDPSYLIGKPLPQRRFLATTGNIVNLDSYKGRTVVLVIMRGVTGNMVCIHCSSQMTALLRNSSKFAERNAELLVVYPGPSETVPSFLEATKTLSATGPDGIPFPLLFDADLAAVMKLSLEGSLAKPTTIILDRDGIVRWAYIGRQPADRPSVQQMLAEVDRLR